MIKIGLYVSSILVIFLLFGCEESPKLPYLGNSDVEYIEKEGVIYADTVYPKIPLFQFINQEGKHVTNSTYKGKIWIQRL